MTTMNRMVEEQRTQIGVLKALGYSEHTIMAKYMFYSGSAALTGCVAGFALGTFLFPKVIWYAYGMLYKMDSLVYVFDWKLAVISVIVSLLCSIGTTFVSVRRELTEVAAELMRPKTPKAGKRVFLEYIPFVWKRLKFLQKVSMRNIFRYKKRFFMMVAGISGCSALLVTGFGVRDSVTGTVYTATNVDELIEAYEDIYLFSGISTVDNDGDGLYDVFEKNGMTLPNGKVIFTDPFKNDTDGDGLVDGLEVLLKKFDYSRHSYVFELKTDPFASDYSNSGICDYDRVNGTNIYGRSYYVSSLNGDIIDIPVGTVAYGYPNISCGEAFTAKAVDQYFQYRASALIYANGEYWIKVNSGDSYGVWGYIICLQIKPVV